MRPCYIFNVASDTEATLDIYDEIGFWGVQAKDFVDQLRGVKAKVLNVEINSPGGDVFAGLAIYNALRASGKEIVVKVMGMAASAASLIAMAGDKIVMPKNSFMMIHNPWSFAMGNADELRETAATLDKIGGSLLQTYASKTGLAEDELKTMLATDTWMTADEALEKGFATEVVDDIKVNAKFDLDRADLPEGVKVAYMAAMKPKASVEDAPAADPVVEDAVVAPEAEQIEALAKAADMGDFAAVWAVTGLGLDDVRSRIKEAREIKALAVVAGVGVEKATAAIKAGTSLKDFRASLVQAMADADQDTDSTALSKDSTMQLSSTTGSSGNPPVNSKSIWDSHRKQTAR